MHGGYVVTIHRGCAELALIRERAQRRQPGSESGLVYMILDGLTDTYFPVLEAIDNEIDAVENEITVGAQHEQVERMFRLKRQLLALRRVVGPMRDIFSTRSDTLEELPGLQKGSHNYFRDIWDHLTRIAEQIDSYRDVLSSAMDVYLSSVSNRTNDVMKQLTIIATVFLPLTFVTGFFGQNFGWLVQRIDTAVAFWGLGVGALVVVLRDPLRGLRAASLVVAGCSLPRPMTIDISRVSEVLTEPGELPPTMTAWVIREERFGEPTDAFQLEEIEVPKPGAFEVLVLVMAAGVNFNSVWAARASRSRVASAMHPEYGYHIGGSDASGIVWKVGHGVTRWKVGDEVVIHCNQSCGECPEVQRPGSAWPRPAQKIWGYETTLGQLRPVHQGPGAAARAQAEAAELGRGRLATASPTSPPTACWSTRAQLRPATTCSSGAPPAASASSPSSCARSSAPSPIAVVSSTGEGRAGQAARRARLHRPQRVRRG